MPKARFTRRGFRIGLDEFQDLDNQRIEVYSRPIPGLPGAQVINYVPALRSAVPRTVNTNTNGKGYPEGGYPPIPGGPGIHIPSSGIPTPNVPVGIPVGYPGNPGIPVGYPGNPGIPVGYPGNPGVPVGVPVGYPPVGCPPQYCAPRHPVCRENQRRFSMSFNQAAVTAGSTVTISASPQKPFKGDRLIIPSTIGPSFTVLAVIIGTAPQNVATGETSAVIYSEVSTNSNVDFDPAFPGINISLQVINISGGTLDFTATLFGDVINGQW